MRPNDYPDSFGQALIAGWRGGRLRKNGNQWIIQMWPPIELATKYEYGINIEIPDVLQWSISDAVDSAISNRLAQIKQALGVAPYGA